jgi:hypothetical protein
MKGKTPGQNTLYVHGEPYIVDPGDPAVRAETDSVLDRHWKRIPDRVKRSLERASYEGPRASGVNWRDVLTPRRTLAADGTQVLNSTTETIMCPDFTFAADVMEVGDAFKYTLLGSISTVITTPGTITLRLRWGGVGGTSLAASGAFAPDPDAASTTVSYCVEWYVVTRSVGSAGSMLAMGKIVWPDYDNASLSTLGNNLGMLMAPVSAPAATGSLDTTTAKALSPTVQFSVATATTQLTNNIAILESLN